jgi:hypothetical protein
LIAFAKSFDPSNMIVRKELPDFYKARKFPKDRAADKSGIIEPEDRPEDAMETAEYSEFAD